MSKRIITFGTFDLFHIGHVELLRRARSYGDHLTVGISTDELNKAKKGHAPLYPLDHRMAIVAAIRYVDHVFPEKSLEAKRDYITRHQADILIMGDDWHGRFDEFSDICEVIYLPRTPIVSSTTIRMQRESCPDSPLPQWDPLAD